MKIRNLSMILLAGLAIVGGTYASQADAALVGTTCTVTSVGWREDMKALRTICGGKVFWNREAVSNSSCGFKTTMDAIKIFQTTANAALLSGKSVQMYYETQTGCNTTDPVIREMYLLN